MFVFFLQIKLEICMFYSLEEICKKIKKIILVSTLPYLSSKAHYEFFKAVYIAVTYSADLCRTCLN